MFAAIGWEMEDLGATLSDKEVGVSVVVRPSQGRSMISACQEMLEEDTDDEGLSLLSKHTSENLATSSTTSYCSELPLELGVMRRFDFSPALQRQSVIVRIPR